MAKEHSVSVKDAVYKIQHYLLGGIQNEQQLTAAGSIISRSDYEDVVTERSIMTVCGYPLCRSSLPSERPRKGRYRISLKEHKVYDLNETYMFCSTDCVVNSKAFAASVQDKRISFLNPLRLDEVLTLLDNSSRNLKEDLGKTEDLGLSQLKIQEKSEANSGEVSLEQWIGPTQAIEGYVPRSDIKPRPPPRRKNHKEGSKSKNIKKMGEKNFPVDEMNFTSVIITQDEYSVSKVPSGLSDVNSGFETSGAKGKGDQDLDSDSVRTESPSAPLKSDQKEMSNVPKCSKYVIKDDSGCRDGSNVVAAGAYKELCSKEAIKSLDTMPNSSPEYSDRKEVQDSPASLNYFQKKSIVQEDENGKAAPHDYLCTPGASFATIPSRSCSHLNIEQKSHAEFGNQLIEGKLKSSLKSLSKKKKVCSVTWADHKNSATVSENLCEVRVLGNATKNLEHGKKGLSDKDRMLVYESAEACAAALSQAAEAIESGESDVHDAMSEAGLVIMPHQPDACENGSIEEFEGDSNESIDGEGREEDNESLEPEYHSLKWKNKTSVSYDDLFDSEDLFYDTLPEGFSLTLSPFATMWNVLFEWITSCSLAFIYGREESYHEEYLSVNGREYPRKIVLEDGRSSEIKQTLASCLARALPGLVAEFGLPIPISTLEQGMSRLLETMTFMEAIPAFRTKQWQVIVLLFLDALSICRIPALLPYMRDRRMLLQKVLDGSEIGREEYDLMMDLMIPLGRVPDFSSQSGA